MAVTLEKKATLQTELTIHISVWEISVGFENGLARGKAASLHNLQLASEVLPSAVISC